MLIEHYSFSSKYSLENTVKKYVDSHENKIKSMGSIFYIIIFLTN